MTKKERDLKGTENYKEFYRKYQKYMVRLMDPCDMNDYLAGMENHKDGARRYAKLLSPAIYTPEIIERYGDRVIFYKNGSDPIEGFVTFVYQIGS